MAAFVSDALKARVKILTVHTCPSNHALNKAVRQEGFLAVKQAVSQVEHAF
jgi:predicted thioredoxin/glutaredoxin